MRIAPGARAVSAWLAARPARFAIVMAVFALGVYAATATENLQGYDPETAATAEGLVRTGAFQIVQPSAFVAPNAPGEGEPGAHGRRVGRAGLPEPLLMTPFYVVGDALDHMAASGTTRFRTLLMLFYNPLISALSAGLVFLLVLRLRSLRAAIAVSALFTVASLAWPYSKIGMDNTSMFGVVLTAVGVVYAMSEDGLWPWALAGLGAGLATAAKGYEALAVVILCLPLIRPWRAANKSQRRRTAVALLAPVVAWAIAVGWYDWAREGSVFKTGAPAYNHLTAAAPLNALGLFVSPGKGLIFYSPLVVVGLLGLRAMRREHPAFATALVGAVAAGTVVVALTSFWSDETWGPRYLLPVAWLLLIPIPWWVRTPRRRNVLLGVAALGVVVQLIAIAAPYRATVPALQSLSGYPLYRPSVFGYTVTPFGFDAPRWIPQLSPLLLQGALVLSWLAVKIGLPPLTLSYAPYTGPSNHVTFGAQFAQATGVPDLWWRSQGALGDIGLLMALFAALAAAWALRQPFRHRGSREPLSDGAFAAVG